MGGTGGGRRLARRRGPAGEQPKQPTAKGPAEWFTGEVIHRPDRSWSRTVTRERQRRPLHPVGTAPPGTRTPSARPSTSPKARVCTSPRRRGRGDPRPATSSTRLPRSGAGTALHPTTSWPTCPSPSPGDGRPEAGWGEHVTDEEYSSHW